MASRRRRTSTTLRSRTSTPRRGAPLRGPSRSTTTTRTLEQVYRPKSEGASTALLVGGAALAIGAGLLLFGGTANAATPPIPGPGQPGGPPGPQGIPGVSPPLPAISAFPQVPGTPLGYSGPGTYRVTAPSGLKIRPSPNTTQGQTGLVAQGGTVQVSAPSTNGWVQISAPAAGFMCISCPEAPSDANASQPWLIRVS